ncbi:MAG TPA: type II secretion system protein, partial [Acidimicrobiales bacterium]|nr:type II secretion system protein [Acidimicrobiales bacterium]
MTLLEVVVALAVLAIILTPTMLLVLQTGSSANQDRLRTEAVNLATARLESIISNANYGVISPGQAISAVSVVENGGRLSDGFQVAVTYDAVTTSHQSLCSTSSGSIAPAQEYVVTATVGWKGDGGDPVVQRTYLAPEQAGAVPGIAGELSVPIDGANGTSYSGGQPVQVTVVGVETESNPPATPSGQVTFESGSTTSGCITFTNLDPNGWAYDVYLGKGDSK